MTSITFENMLTLYNNVDFDEQGDEGVLHVRTPGVLSTLHLVEAETAARDANFTCLDEYASLAVGQSIRVRAGPPSPRVGILARTFDDLLDAPGARIAEPENYYVIEGRIRSKLPSPPEIVKGYQRVLGAVALITEAASYTDRVLQEAIFIRDGKFILPIDYRSIDCLNADRKSLDIFANIFSDDLHRDHKLELLADSVYSHSKSLPAKDRLSLLLRDISIVTKELSDGYKLFASSFSYRKIKDEMESAKVDYISKIHRTFSDIQGQLLGLPVAAVIVATQLKYARGCGQELLANSSLLFGAYFFAGLLVIGLLNQWTTLSAIKSEIGKQKDRLQTDYSAISANFLPIFESLEGRAKWHRRGLIAIGGAVLLAVAFATLAYRQMTSVSIVGCLVS